MNTTKASYVVSKNQSVLLLEHRDNKQLINLDTIKNYDSFHMIITDVIKEDLKFVSKLMEICNQEGYLNYCIMAKTLDSDIVSELQRLGKKHFNNNFTKMVFSISLAMDNELCEDCYIGTYLYSDELLLAQPINAGELKYSDFKKAKPYAKQLADTISFMGLESDIEKIICIDNWFQKNIQYIKGRETETETKKYICNQIESTAKLSDVFLHHYGVCEDISTSIAMVLHYLNIPYEEVHGRNHAWLIVAIEGKNYIWDCTHNITRNKNLVDSALKCTKYSYEFTLIGLDTYPNKYIHINSQLPKPERSRLPIEQIQEAICYLSKEKGVSFDYSYNAPYPSKVDVAVC